MLLGDFKPVRLAMGNLPVHKRVEMWHEVVGREILRLDSEPLTDSDVAFDADLTLRAMPGLRTAIGSVGGSQDRRTRELIRDGNSDVVLAINLAGPLLVSHKGQDLTVQGGDAFLLDCAEPASFKRPLPGKIAAFQVSRAALAPLVGGIDDLCGRMVDRANPALRLLVHYIGALDHLPSGTAPPLENAVFAHICDLVALALGARRDAAVVAQRRGYSAACFGDIKADIVRNSACPTLTIGMVAARHGVTVRQVQRLFEREGTTFSEFLVQERLARAYRTLADPTGAALAIGSVAFACGFEDASYFNRRFRARYGATPSAIRAANGKGGS